MGGGDTMRSTCVTTDAETAPARGTVRICLELAKPRLTALVAATAGAGYVLGGAAPGYGWPLFWTLLGTALAAGGANAVNQWLEAGRDGRMERTRGRPFARGRLGLLRGFAWTIGVIAVGVAILGVGVNWRAGALAALAAAIYLFLYTPLKVRNSLCTLVGAVSGAIPPMIGWVAASGRLDPGAWMLGGLLYAWQVPHFLSLAWLHRSDYEKGGFLMLATSDPSGRATCRMALLYTAALLPLSLMPSLGGIAGPTYAVGAILCGAGMLVLAVRLHRRRADADAGRLFRASLAYLPLVLALMMADRRPG